MTIFTDKLSEAQRLQVTHFAAIETVAIANYESTVRHAQSLGSTGWPDWSVLALERRIRHREIAVDLLAEYSQPLPAPPKPLAERIEAAREACIANGEDPDGYLDYSDLRKGKQNWEYYLEKADD